MVEPAFKRPFEQQDFRGYFRWSQKLTKRLGGDLYHACHVDELRDILDKGMLSLRSEWSLRLPQHGLWSAPGTWTGLNYYNNGNHYGPMLIRLPLSVLDGRHFMAFRREGDDRKRYFFVQYEARLPVYSFGKAQWRYVRPESYFTKHRDELITKPGAIYDIVITEPLPLDDVVVEGTNHPRCIPEKCSGSSLLKSRRLAGKVAKEQFREWMRKSKEYRSFFGRFPDVEGSEVSLDDPDEIG